MQDLKNKKKKGRGKNWTKITLNFSSFFIIFRNLTQNQLKQRLQFCQSQKYISEVLNYLCSELKQFVTLSGKKESHFGRRLCRTCIYCLRGSKDGGFGLQSEENGRGQSCISPYVTVTVYLGIAIYVSWKC